MAVVVAKLESMSSKIDEIYRQKIAAISPQERVSMASSQYESIKKMLGHQIRQQDSQISERQLSIEIARRMYLSDSDTVALLDRIEVKDNG